MIMEDNILTLMETQKTELILLTRRVTDLEIGRLKIIRKWANEKNVSGELLKSLEQNLFSSNEM
jgi:hypothetical protein